MLVPASAHVSRLIAARFQLDLLKSTMLLIARTDAESAKLLSSTVDVLDHAFVRGVSAPDRALAEVIAAAEAEGTWDRRAGRRQRQEEEEQEAEDELDGLVDQKMPSGAAGPAFPGLPGLSLPANGMPPPPPPRPPPLPRPKLPKSSPPPRPPKPPPPPPPPRQSPPPPPPPGPPR